MRIIKSGEGDIQLKLKKLHKATDNLIEQQFYRRGTDTIVGRTPEISMKIKNSGLIVKRFKDLFYENLMYFINGQFLNFFEPFTQIKGMDENYIKEINQEIEIKLTALQDTEYDLVISYTLVLSSLISRIRDIHFNDAIHEIIKRIKHKSQKLSENEIHSELEDLFMKNNKYVSLLYNISYLGALADSFHFKKVARTCKIQKSKLINQIVDIIT
ncbi:MAG: hypothetical protein EU535_08305 [Promethearchaeota archaeon]|nr:MAG: hypothetical protein EU535_08305 [Candidatus Lokiarchaeota archaeon]